MSIQVGVIMGSSSDWETLRHAAETLERFGVAHEVQVVSAHRTPEQMYEYAKSAAGRGLKAIIAGAGGAAHLPGMVSALTPLPVLGVPVQTRALAGVDSLLSIVQMPAGVPTATFAIGPAGATNAALFVVRMLAVGNAELSRKLEAHRADSEARALRSTADLQPEVTVSARAPAAAATRGLPRPRATPAVPRRRRGKPGR
jgi:5-(carboxyamino)imidazole ribonucleotide mutase